MSSWLLSIDWATVGKTALGALIGAGLGSALVQGAFSLMAERRRRTAQATYLAMRLAVLLDAFGLSCSDMIVRNAHAEAPPDQEFPNWEGLPELPPYPEDSEGWVSLRSTLGIQCLRLRSRHRESEGLLRVTAEYSEDDLGDTLDEQAAQLGLEASRLAEKLGRRYGFDSGTGEYEPSLKSAQERAIKAMRGRRGAVFIDTSV